MRRAAKVDANHVEIVEALKAVGASVVSLASVGRGCPDLLVGFRGKTYVMEVKDGAKPPSRQKLTDDQNKFVGLWRGQYALVTNVNDALRAVGAHVSALT